MSSKLANKPSPASTPAPFIQIGALAARTGRSVHTIRWYESQGLIPGVSRDASGRRFYTEAHIEWLNLMLRLRETGMSIAEMRRYTALVRSGESTLAERQAMLLAHREHVTATIQAWQAAVTMLDGKIDLYEQWQRTGKRPLREVPPGAKSSPPLSRPLRRKEQSS
jgi:DNA-binding transcriptional MerR regulator